MKKIKYPKVLLVGRTNVGKSTLFNRLINEKKSIVLDREGVTRDYVEDLVTWDDKTFSLVDTGGLQHKREINPIDQLVQEKVVALIKSAAMILFVCDGKNGLTREDKVIAKQLHSFNKPTILVVNKADNEDIKREQGSEFYSLGFKEIFYTSATHGSGIGNLLDRISQGVSTAHQQEVQIPSYNIAIIGKPNVGKSSLMNLLINQERSIVSDIAGTTREAISEKIYHCSDLIQVTDTPGIRKKSRVCDELETLMVKSSLKTVREADIVLLVVDASAGPISDQELKLLFLIYEEKKPLLVIFNKTDIIDDYAATLLEQSKEAYDFILKKVPTVSISCVTKKNVGKIFNHVQKVWDRCQQHFNSTEVDELVKGELSTKPLYHTKVELKLFKIRHTEGKVPTFVLHVNYPEWFGPSQLACIENILRKHYDLKGCPISFIVRKP